MEVVALRAVECVCGFEALAENVDELLECRQVAHQRSACLPPKQPSDDGGEACAESDGRSDREQEQFHEFASIFRGVASAREGAGTTAFPVFIWDRLSVTPMMRWRRGSRTARRPFWARVRDALTSVIYE